jgi:hypothetical protein
MQVAAVPYNLFLIFTIAVVFCAVVQAGVFLGLYFIARTAAAKAEKIADEMSGKALPIIVQSRTLLEDLSPRIRVIAANLAEISTTLKDQTKHVNSTVGEVVDKTRTQAERVDEMVTAVLDGVTHASATIQTGVSKPVRKLNGILEGFRVAVETFVRSNSGPRSTPAAPASATQSSTTRNSASAAGYQTSTHPIPHPVPVPAEPFLSEPIPEAMAAKPGVAEPLDQPATTQAVPVPPPNAEPL